MGDGAVTAGAELRVPVRGLTVAAYKVPTDKPESDGTLEWDSTTMVTVEIEAGGTTGLGYTYADRSVATLVENKLAPALHGLDASATRLCWRRMIDATRNQGRRGLVSMAISACDVALHDLKGKLLGISAADLLGRRLEQVPVYGSGGFTSYSDDELKEQVCDWARQGFQAIKMKVGREPERDLARVKAAREAIGDGVDLFVDANGAYDRKQALEFAFRARDAGVTWFEEPVSSNDLEGLRLLRDEGPPGLEITAGEYGFSTRYFLDMARAGAVDVLQADATRCAGFTGFQLADAVAHAFELPLSSHCAPALHLPCCVAALQMRHMEWFHDHVRIEQLLFEGAPDPRDGVVAPDLSKPGLGLALKRADAEAYRI